jgi:hypothetical protein
MSPRIDVPCRKMSAMANWVRADVTFAFAVLQDEVPAEFAYAIMGEQAAHVVGRPSHPLRQRPVVFVESPGGTVLAAQCLRLRIHAAVEAGSDTRLRAPQGVRRVATGQNFDPRSAGV